MNVAFTIWVTGVIAIEATFLLVLLMLERR